MPQSKFGGIPVEDEKLKTGGSKFGGVPVDEAPGQHGSGSGRNYPDAGPKNDNPPADYGISQWLPSGRTVVQGGGAAIGGLVGSGVGPLGTVGGGALGGAAGEAAYQLGQRLRGKPAPETSGDAAKEIGMGGINGAIQEGVGELLPHMGRSAASRLYRTALKPSTRFTTEEAQGITDTLLKNRIPISDAGMRKLNNGISGLNTKIDSEIASNPAAEVSPYAVAKRIDPAIDDFQYKDLHKDLTAAEAEKSAFIDRHSTPVPYTPYPPSGRVMPPAVRTYPMEAPIPATRAQAMKKAIWQELAPNDFGTVAEGYKQARKAEGMGLKEQLEGLFPRIQDLNAQEGRLLEARPELNRAINRTENRDVLGIGAPIASGAVGALTGSKGLSVAAALAKNAGSRTAILMDILSHPVAGVTPAALPRFGIPPLLRRLGGTAPGLVRSANQ